MSDYDFELEEHQSQANKQILLRILRLMLPHWKWLVGFLVAVGVVAGLDSYFTYLSKQVIDTGIVAHNRQAVFQIFTIYGAMLLVQAVAVFAFIYLVSLMGERVRYDLRNSLFAHLQSLSLSYYSRTPVGWIMARVTSDTDRVSEMMTWGVLDVTWATLNILTAAYFMLIINWRLALIVLISIPALMFVAVWFRRKILGEYRKVRRLNSRITAAYNENISGVRVVKALSREDENLREFEVLTGNMYQAGYRAAWLSALFLPVVQIISASALAGVVWFSGSQIQVGVMTAGAIHAFVSYITSMMWPVQDLARVFAEFQHAIASAERIFSLLDTDPEIKDLPDAFDPGSVRGDIRFDHVDFYYEADKPVLTDFDLFVRHGQTIALVGPTGGGKTTIVNLLGRFYEPKAGKITIGGQDYTSYSTHAIQSRIGIVLQTPHLFSGTIRDNIRYGRLNASDDEVEQAARTAGAFDFINAFEKGFEQEVGEGGSLLSVGQKQLISLARAVLAQPEIFIMDEATSSVDTLTEAMIQRGMEALMEGRTSFIIAHRLSTIRRADLIVVVDGGTIAEKGTHNELMQRRGKYYNLYTKQFRHEKLAEHA
ncbi:MAG TPA: ABC transporter ATP-binding protein [Anaerolineaceae bacterium]|nr:ABC transporter ATP-binding protein [Anaerolineaceae bacterium]